MKYVLCVLLLLTACKTLPTQVVDAVTANQQPGTVQGAGATITSPTNAKSASTMTAQKRTAYYAPPTRQWPLAQTGVQSAEHDGPTASSPSSTSTAAYPPVAWIDEKVTTSISEHQDAAAIIKVAEEAGKWSKTRWVGIALIVGSIIFALYYRGTDGGYPMVYMKTGTIGAAVAIIDPSPWWLLSLIVPAGFYAAQKFNLLNLIK